MLFNEVLSNSLCFPFSYRFCSNCFSLGKRLRIIRYVIPERITHMNEQINELLRLNNIYAITAIATQLRNMGSTLRNIFQGD